MTELVVADRDEAKRLLAEAAHETDESDDRKLRDLAVWLVSMDDPEDVLGREERRTVTMTQIIGRARDALGEPRRVVHSFAGTSMMMLGADLDLAGALKWIDEADEVAWVPHPLGHELATRTSVREVLNAAAGAEPRPLGHELEARTRDTVRYFAVRKPGGW